MRRPIVQITRNALGAIDQLLRQAPDTEEGEENDDTMKTRTEISNVRKARCLMRSRVSGRFRSHFGLCLRVCSRRNGLLLCRHHVCAIVCVRYLAASSAACEQPQPVM